MSAPGKYPAARLWSVAIVLGYAVVVAVTLPSHEPWRDEAQGWMIVRSLGLGGIFRQMGYEGTPALWHLLQLPLAKFGMPYASLGVLNAVIAIGAIAVLCLASPFSTWQKAAVAFSYIMLYEYGVIARCYALIVLCLFVVAALYPSRHERRVAYGAALFALANINVQSLSIAGLMALMLLMECRQRKEPGGRKWIGFALAAAGIAAAVVQLRPPPDLLNGGLFPNFMPRSIAAIPQGALLPRTFVPVEIGMAVAVAALAVIFWDLRRNLASLAIVAAVYLGWCYLFVFKLYYAAQLRHTGLFAMALVFVLWLSRSDEKSSPDSPRFRWSRSPSGPPRLRIAEWVTFGALLLSSLHGFLSCRSEFSEMFSGAREAAEFVAEQDPGIELAAFHSWSGIGLLPWLPGRHVWSIEVGKPVTFTTFTRQLHANIDLTDDEIIRRAVLHGGPKRPWLLLTHPLADPRAHRYALVFHNSEQAKSWDETFFVYAPE